VKVRPFDLAILAVGVCAVSTAAVLIRETDAPALVIAAYRLAVASLPLLAVSALRSEGKRTSHDNRTLLCILAGVFLALHFAFWVASVKQTSIVTSVVLVTAQPLLVALASGPLLGERPHGSIWLGLALATAGAAVMVGDDIGAGSDTLVGDLYAILGAVFAAAYFIVGRSVQTAGTGWLRYVTVAYTAAAIVLIAMALASGASVTGYSTETYRYFMLLALVPQLIGHTALNRSLAYLPAISVTIAVLGEPVGATILGAIVLDETPSALELAGGALILAGVYAGLRASMRTSAPS
jgi:drug/metabolite transporter (DMT)-like permease